MTHEQAVAGDIIDGYIADTLSSQQRAAFEEHFFECDECFAGLQAAGALRTGVRELARRGELDAVPAPLPSAAASPAPAMQYAPWLALAATLVIATTSFMSQQRRYEDAQLELHRLRDRHGALQQELDRVKSEAAAPARPTAEANLPVAILQSARSSNTRTTIAIPSGAARLVLWIEDPPPLSADAVMTLVGPDETIVATVNGLQRNQQGAIVAAFPAAAMAAGAYSVRVTASGRLLSEYPLIITRQP